MAIPVTVPVMLTVAMVMSLLVQVPPVVASVSVVVAPVHTVDAPVMAAADVPGLTVMVAVADVVPQLPVTV